MYKYFFVFSVCLLFSVNVLAEGNVFCNNQPTSSPLCTTASRTMYQGFLEGYARKMVQYSQENGLMPNKQQAKLEAQKLISYDTLYKYFRICGESKKNFNDAQACMISNLENFTLKKMGQGF